jgi:hypothetical protein
MLFDLRDDPTEQKNVASRNRQTARKMRNAISAWMHRRKRYGAARKKLVSRVSPCCRGECPVSQCSYRIHLWIPTLKSMMP